MTEADHTSTVQLARHLGLFEAVMIGVGAMIGAGIFVLTGIASGQAGPAALLAFGLNGVVTLFTALSYAELSSAVPEAGGGYSFVKKVMPNPVAFISGWMLWFAYVVACSLYAKGFGSYFLEFFHRYVPAISNTMLEALGHEATVAVLTLAVGALFVGVNIAGTHASGKTEDVITMLKIIILAVFIGFGVVAIAGDPGITRANFSDFLPMGAGGVLAAMGLTFLAFEGYDLIATVSEEVKDPERTIPRAIIYSLGITVVIYLLVVFVCLGAVPATGGVPTWRMLGEAGEMGIVQAAQSFMPRFGVILVLGGGLFATLSALNATVLASSRVAFSMGRDWMLPNRLSRIHSVRRTPVLAIGVSGLLFLAVGVFLPLQTIGTASSLLFLLTFALVNGALILYRRRATSPPPFRVPLFPVTPILGILTSAGLAIFQLFEEPAAWGLAAAWIAIGVGIYLVFFSRRARVADVPRAIESPELLQLRKARPYRVLVPAANPEKVAPLIDMAGRIASTSRGEVVALTVVDLPDVTSYLEAEPFVNEGHQVLGRAHQLAMDAGIPFSSLLRIGRSAPEEIVEVARSNRCDLILMGYKREEDPLENSLIHHVASHQPCDLAILKTGVDEDLPLRRVLVPLGGKEIHDRLKVRIVQSLARGEDCEVVFLMVVPSQADAPARKFAGESLRRAVSLYGIPQAVTEILESDDVEGAIVERARSTDLMLLGMRDEPWFRSFLFGSLAQSIARQVTCPTLLTKAWVRPKGRLKRLLRLQPTRG